MGLSARVFPYDCNLHMQILDANITRRHHTILHLLPCSLTAVFCASSGWKVRCFFSCAVFLCCFSYFYLHAKQVSFEFPSWIAYIIKQRAEK